MFGAEFWKNQLTFRGSLLEQVQIRLLLLMIEPIVPFVLTPIPARHGESFALQMLILDMPK
ncbi:hypothetical protein ACHELOUS_205 [Vibrio phage Achelous]|uniref:Uncharacterized protein n=1 Tax=Vibrio phage Achelous TaxID=2576872 RepID=A0A4P8MVF3_9CAUD|nr:hypothetical protein KNU52_gp090 [Vibrio phage Achelous]QCQ57780.1 hypothetical protein ACHELOUS_205 [Vibrio phage Achelous]